MKTALPAPTRPVRRVRLAAGWGLCGLVLAGGTLVAAGCGLSSKSRFKDSTEPFRRDLRQAEALDQTALPDLPTNAAGIRRAAHLREAVALEGMNCPTCVDAYYAAATEGWKALRDRAAAARLPCREPLDYGCDDPDAAAYRAAVAKLLETGRKYGRLDPRVGLTVERAGRKHCIPVEHVGFAWGAEDFDRVEVAADYGTDQLHKLQQRPGLGLPTVVVKRRRAGDRFAADGQAFSATALLLPSGPEAAAPFALRLVNPAEIERVPTDDLDAPLAGDLSAPHARLIAENRRTFLEGFLRPGSTDDPSQLVMLEPYRPGKIPVVFIHGLLSDPQTWIPPVNDLLGEAWFRERYQPWFFRYATGRPFLAAAAELRRELKAALALPAAADDPAARNMVLIGHSMGGLVSKMQISASGTAVWDLVAYRPFETLVADDRDRARLRSVFFWQPQPHVKRVVFIGTPHNGSTDARRWLARAASFLVRPSEEQRTHYQRLKDDNPTLFKPVVERGIPTSIDLLTPDHPLLVALADLPRAKDVRRHSIIGDKYFLPAQGPSDGIVPVDSARIPNVDSERLLPEFHEYLHQVPATVAELTRILQEHLAAYDAEHASPLPEGFSPLTEEIVLPAAARKENAPAESRAK